MCNAILTLPQKIGQDATGIGMRHKDDILEIVHEQVVPDRRGVVRQADVGTCLGASVTHSGKIRSCHLVSHGPQGGDSWSPGPAAMPCPMDKAERLGVFCLGLHGRVPRQTRPITAAERAARRVSFIFFFPVDGWRCSDCT